MLIVAKKDGSLRPVVDYHKLKKITVLNTFPMSQIEELIDELATAKYIMALDLTKGYWKVPVEKKPEEKTAFVI